MLVRPLTTRSKPRTLASAAALRRLKQRNPTVKHRRFQHGTKAPPAVVALLEERRKLVKQALADKARLRRTKPPLSPSDKAYCDLDQSIKSCEQRLKRNFAKLLPKVKTPNASALLTLSATTRTDSSVSFTPVFHSLLRRMMRALVPRRSSVNSSVTFSLAYCSVLRTRLRAFQRSIEEVSRPRMNPQLTCFLLKSRGRRSTR